MRVRRGFIVSLGALVTMSVLAILQVPPSKEDVLPTQAAWTSVKNARVVDEAVKKHQAVAAYGKLPLNFEANQGQADDAVKFLARGNGYTLFLTSTEAVLSLRKAAPSGPKDAGMISTSHNLQSTIQNRQAAVLRIKLIGANPAPRTLGLEDLPGKSNYFIGNDAKKWQTKVSSYAKVKYQDVYPGIDLVYYGNQRQLEHDFVVAPATDPKTIMLQVQGGRAMRVDNQGDLVLETQGGEVRFCKPRIYQDVKGARQEIAGGYVLRGRRRVGFEVTAYDDTKPLVIDPVLSYSTYLGGSGDDLAHGIAVDSAGNAYVTGETVSTNFPTSAGAFQTAFGGAPSDAFVTKFNATGNAIVYSTYLGGSGGDSGFAIALDSAGNAYVTGPTSSANFPTTSTALQVIFNGGIADAFVTKLNATGSTLLYSTYLGGSGHDFGEGVAVDSAGNAYVVGATASSNFPTTTGALQTTFSGAPNEVFMTKIDTTKSGTASLIYSTYLGGSGSNDQAFGVVIDSAGNAYVTGRTSSTSFPATLTAFQPISNGGDEAFVTRIDTTKTGAASLVYSTYLGGSGGESGQGIAVDSAGNTYVVGWTNSTNFPTTAGAFQTAFRGGGVDAFVTKIDTTKSGTASLIYSTYLGGGSDDQGEGIALDSAGNAYVTGVTRSADFPTTSTAFQKVLGGALDAFVTKLNATGSTLLYSTYFGGSSGTGTDAGNAIVVDSNGNAYITGWTDSTNFPTTTGAFQTIFGGVRDAFIAKFAFAPAVTVSPTNLSFGSQNDGTTSAPLTVTLTNAGEAQLTITGIVIGGANSGDFAQANTCGSSVAAGANCTIAVTFSPTAPGARNGTLTIIDNAADSPQTVMLTGTGIASVVTLSPNSLTFFGQLVGSTSTAQNVTLTNNSTGTLTISSIVVNGANSSDFSKGSDTCGASVNAGASCIIPVSFAPAAVGTRNATLTITDNTAGSPQTVNLTGTGTDFSLGPASGGSTTATVTAGQTATYNLQVIPSGFNGTVMLTCSGAPAAATCSVSPTSATLSGGTASPFSVSVTTTARSVAPRPTEPMRIHPLGGLRVSLPVLLALALLAMLACLAAARRLKPTIVLPTAMVLLGLLLIGCSGGSSSGTSTPKGTAPGTSTLTVTGTSGSTNRNITLKLTVN